MIGIALLQNGRLPTFLPPNVIESPVIKTENPCISKLHMQKFPILLHLHRQHNQALMLLKLLAPALSEQGSSVYLKERALYALFVKYVWQVASGRREPITLGSLNFATCASEEPPLGFVVRPSKNSIHM